MNDRPGRRATGFPSTRPRSAIWLRWVLLALAAGMLLSLGAVAATQLVAPSSNSPSPSASALACSPKPCVDLQGYTMWVSNIKEGNGLIQMQVKFRNSSNSTHAAPEDLSLVDSTGHVSPSMQDSPGCTHWGRTEFNNGASYGPITVCFAPASLDPPVRLRWTPDMGFFCCQADLRIK